MTTFPLLDLKSMKMGPSSGSGIKKAPRILKANFGNGYVQKSGDGRNANPITYNLKLINLTIAESTAIMAFFEERKGYLPFRLQLPREATPRQWTCEVWEQEYVDGVIDGVTATLMEDFTP